jgi:hypothetical protein
MTNDDDEKFSLPWAGFALGLLYVLLLCLAGSTVHAQQPVVEYPNLRSTLNASGAITATGVFQSVFASGQTNRTACTIQNNGAANQWVFFGPIASATAATSVLLIPGMAVSCNGPGVTLNDQVSITGTIGDTF